MILSCCIVSIVCKLSIRGKSRSKNYSLQKQSKYAKTNIEEDQFQMISLDKSKGMNSDEIQSSNSFANSDSESENLPLPDYPSTEQDNADINVTVEINPKYKDEMLPEGEINPLLIQIRSIKLKKINEKIDKIK